MICQAFGMTETGVFQLHFLPVFHNAIGIVRNSSELMEQFWKSVLWI